MGPTTSTPLLILLTLLTVTPALVGCMGGNDGSAGSAWATGSQGDGQGPTLPADLEMEGAEVVTRTEHEVVWRWDGTVGPGLAGRTEDPGVTSTTFEVPAGLGFAVEANLTWDNDDATDIGVRVQDASGAAVCTGVPPGSAAYPSTAPASACASWEEALETRERWRISAETYLSRRAETPFSVVLRLQARPASDLEALAEMHPFKVEAEDGKTLRGHVYLPTGQGPFATVLELSGYWNTAFNRALGSSASHEMATQDGDRTTLKGYLGWFLDAGFAVALVNIRGTGISGGCQDFAGSVDVADAGRVIQALADQPWSDGDVGMVGGSWPGTSVYTGIASGASPLKAAVPFSATIDWWHDETENGAPSGTPGQALVYDGLGASPHPVAMPQRYGCPEHPGHLAENLGYLETGDRTPWYEERGHREALNGTSAAILAAYGMANAEWVPLRDHGFWDRIPHDNKSLLLGQWRHNPPARADWWPDVVAWFDHHLRDGPEPGFAGLVRYQDAAGTWHQGHSWSPRGADVVLHLSDGHLVQARDGVARSQAELASSQRRALPDTCPDTAIFVSPPLAEDVVIAGVFRANLTISSTLPDGNFAANLWHVEEPWPCGAAPGLQGATSGTGTLAGPNPGQERYEVGFALTDLYHRGHLEVGEDFPTDGPGVMRMTSESFAAFVPAGERLVLAVGGGDPLLIEDPLKPTLTVQTGPDVEGELVLNVVEGNTTFATQPAPDGAIVTGVAS